ncbi:hypothetical protein ACFY1L_35870 [Streptomyces sp. NPDC001663]|uniref:hypothetical protein n=1 Tax=Streptomyces sp. NPDC001663 TaxID=3364597 RepID=UPI0036B9EE05
MRARTCSARLRRNEGNPTRALREWEQRMRPFIAAQQHLGREELVTFVPQTRRDQAARTVLRQLATTPGGKRALTALNARKAETRSIYVAAP